MTGFDINEFKKSGLENPARNTHFNIDILGLKKSQFITHAVKQTENRLYLSIFEDEDGDTSKFLREKLNQHVRAVMTNFNTSGNALESIEYDLILVGRTHDGEFTWQQDDIRLVSHTGIFEVAHVEYVEPLPSHIAETMDRQYVG